jgi:hypothetical protein
VHVPSMAMSASTLEEIEWNAQGTSHSCVDKFMIGFRKDGCTIKRGKLVCISVI